MEESVVIVDVSVHVHVSAASGDVVSNMKEHTSLDNPHSRMYNMSKQELLVSGLETLITNGIKILLVGILLGIIGTAVWAYLNPMQFLNGIISILPMLAIGLVILAIAAKIKLAVK